MAIIIKQPTGHTLIHLKLGTAHILPLMCDSTHPVINLGQLDVHVDNPSNVFCLTSLNSMSLISFPFHISHPFYITRNRLKLETSNIQFLSITSNQDFSFNYSQVVGFSTLSGFHSIGPLLFHFLSTITSHLVL